MSKNPWLFNISIHGVGASDVVKFKPRPARVLKNTAHLFVALSGGGSAANKIKFGPDAYGAVCARRERDCAYEYNGGKQNGKSCGAACFFA